MEITWSDKKNINTLINVLIFLVSINFLHYGQFILPIICLMLFFENKRIFFVNNIKIFIILILFGISFFAFSFKLGFYSTMGFCLPMAYYIGSNMRVANKKSIKELIYVITLGMISHLILNFNCDLFSFGLDVFTSRFHYDIWLLDNIKETTTAVNYVFFIGIIYYVVVHEDNKLIKRIGIALFIFSLIYDIALGRRTPIVMLFIVVFVCLLLDIYVFKSKTINSKPILIGMMILVFSILVIEIIFVYNLFDAYSFLKQIRIIDKFDWQGLNPERINIFLDAVKNAPNHLWGGRELRDLLDINIHDLWMDTYDYAGIVPFSLLLSHTVYFILCFVRIIKNKKYDKSFRLLLISLFLCIALQMLLEPVMTGSSIFLIVTIILEAALEKMDLKNAK